MSELEIWLRQQIAICEELLANKSIDKYWREVVVIFHAEFLDDLQQEQARETVE